VLDEQQYNINNNSRKGNKLSSRHTFDYNYKRPAQLSVNSPQKDQNELLEKLESLRTPSSKAFKKVLQNNMKFSYKSNSNFDGEEQKEERKLSSDETHKKSKSFFTNPRGVSGTDSIPTTRIIKLDEASNMLMVEKINEEPNADSEDTVTFEHYNRSAKKKVGRNPDLKADKNEDLKLEIRLLVNNMQNLLSKLSPRAESPILVKEDYCKTQSDLENSLRELNSRISQI
jgi:hypothetical protein